MAFGERPVDFLLENLEKYGPVFSFTMFGTDVTYVKIRRPTPFPAENLLEGTDGLLRPPVNP